MPALSEYVNVYNSALAVLREKGFQVWVDEKLGLFCAEREGWDFKAESPLSLLGLVSILEHIRPEEYREYWWRREEGEDYRSLSTAPLPYQSVVAGRANR